jgi:plastocyanin
MSDPTRTHEPVVREDEEEELPPGPRLPGFAYPLLAVGFAGVLVWSFSRILLAVNKDQASVIALLMALNLLIGAALIAYGTRVRRRPAAFPFLLIAALVLIAGGTVSAFTFGDRGVEEAAGGEKPETQAVTLEAKGIKFTQKELTLTAGAEIRMTFKNEDAGTQHNFALFNGADASAPPVFQGSLSTGPTTVTYTFTAPTKPGDYFFHCDVHPAAMTGTAKVEAGGGGEAGAPTEEAKGIKFLQPKLSVAPSGDKVTIHFVNSDAGTQHNIALFQGSDATAPLLFRGELIAGPASVDYTFEAPPAGSYFFHCDVHPTMTGTLTISGG